MKNSKFVITVCATLFLSLLILPLKHTRASYYSNLTVSINNGTFNQMVNTAPWAAIGGTQCTFTANNSNIAQNAEINALNATGMCSDGNTPLSFNASYNVLDKNGNFLANCTFKVTGTPNGETGPSQGNWTNMQQPTISCGNSSVTATGILKGRHISIFVVAKPQ